MQVVAAGRASSRPAPIGCPHRSHAAVLPGRQPRQRRVRRRHLLARRLEQGGGVLPLEGQRRALRVVLVVGPGRAGRLGQPGELPLQRRHPLPRPPPLLLQPLPHRITSTVHHR